jgi:hypothetical protein
MKTAGLFPISAVATRLRVKRARVHQLQTEYMLPAVRIGNYWFWTEETFADLERKQKENPRCLERRLKRRAAKKKGGPKS